MDDEEIAFKDKQKAGMRVLIRSFRESAYIKADQSGRCQSQQRDGGEGKGERTAKCWTAGNQEVGQEVGVPCEDIGSMTRAGAPAVAAILVMNRSLRRRLRS